MQSGRRPGSATVLTAPGDGTEGGYTQGLSCCCVQSSREEEAARVLFAVCDEYATKEDVSVIYSDPKLYVY
jgi:hypothetical protein